MQIRGESGVELTPLVWLSLADSVLHPRIAGYSALDYSRYVPIMDLQDSSIALEPNPSPSSPDYREGMRA